MKKNDLRICDIVTYQDGDKAILMDYNGKLCLVGDEAYLNIQYLDDDMLCDSCDDCNIMSVSRAEKERQLIPKNWEMAPIIWERKEPKKMTVEEISEALGYEVEVI